MQCAAARGKPQMGSEGEGMDAQLQPLGPVNQPG